MASSSKAAYVPPGQRSESFIPIGHDRLLAEEKGGKKIEHAVFSYQELEALKKGNAGYGGIIPWYVDERDHELKFILNITKKYNGLLGYIGGGIRASENPLSKIMTEVDEETPQWEEYLYSLLSNPAYQRLVMVRDEYYPKNAMKTRRSLRMSILIFLRVDPRIMNNTTFIDSDEIDRLYVTSIHDLVHYQPPPSFVSLWEGYEHGLSNGLLHVMEVLTTIQLFTPFWKFIRLNITFEEYKGLLRVMYQQNNIENKVAWPSQEEEAPSSPSKSSPRRSTSKSPSKFPKKSSTRKAPRKPSKPFSSK